MSIRIMTYNVHGCKGTDGVISPERIAEVIARYKPDVIALQELDVNRMRSRQEDQPHRIAKCLDWQFHYFPSFDVEEGSYGNAVISRFPAEIVKAGTLPRLETDPKRSDHSKNPILETRGALWVTIDWEGTPLQLIATHLGLRKQERSLQIRTLLGESWLQAALAAGPTVFCGDLNAWPRTQTYKKVALHLDDVYRDLGRRKPATFPSRFRLLAIDHIFIDDRLEATACVVPKGPLERKASDHLPLITDLSLKND